MDKTILKNFAVESRKDLMDKIERKISLYYVDENFDKSINGDIVVLSNDKHSITLTKKQSDNRDNLVRRIHELGLEQVIEESAYTWFNRLVAIRYMEINDYLPLTKDNQSLGFRVLSSQDNTLDPEILKFTNLSNTSLDIDFNSNNYSNLNNIDEKFKYVLLLVCKKLGKVIPQVFDGVTDYIDLLIPDNLLSSGSVLDKLIKIPENNFKEVEVIGWLYQYYNQTEKERAMSVNRAYKKEEIPYVTQLFTPDWIVKYMVENSLGRYYVEHNGISDIINNWRYFIKDNLDNTNDKIDVSKIKCIDPCSGSGHILVYMFEVLYQMYINEGYNKNDIPELILKNNLYGLDIDDRAGQLSILSVILKAREYDKNIFNKNIVKDINILSLQESKGIDTSYFDQDLITTANIDYLIDMFKDAKEIGSLLKVEKRDYSYALDRLSGNILDLNLLEQIKPLIRQADILSSKYTIMVTNPPYMNNSSMSNTIRKYLEEHYNKSKTDLYASFMEIDVLSSNGYLSMINQHGWMFLGSFTDLRKSIIDKYDISSLIQLGPRAFEDISGEVVQSVTFVFKKSIKEERRKGYYYNLIDANDAKAKENQYLAIKNNPIIANIDDFKYLPDCIIGYWVSPNMREIFKNSEKLGDLIPVKKGADTGNNAKYLRLWWEVNYNSISYYSKGKNIIKWVPYNKGDGYRKWYGNNNNIVNWENDGFELKNSTANLRSQQLYFKDSITWSAVSTSKTSFRLSDYDAIFDSAGSSMFPTRNINNYIGLCNSNMINIMLNIINPTMNFGAGSISKIPVKNEILNSQKIDKLSNNCINISKEDWDSFETSWGFKKHPLLRSKFKDVTIKDTLNNWNTYTFEQISQLKENEESLEREILSIYGLLDEVEVVVEDEELSIRNVDNLKNIKSFISYAVGCMFGRYSLDEEGLIYAGGEWDISKYKTFIPDNDNIIPIADNNDIFYSDDIVGEFIKFVEIAFGKDTLRENLDYIAETLGKKGIETSEDTIRRYFLNDFYKDHLQTYQKRPIYWMFDSGKSNGFKCLIYMHRYNEQTVSKIKVDYFLKVQESYRNQLAAVQERLNGVNGLTTTEIRELRNKEIDLTDKLKECKDYYEKLDHIANEMIKIDLDDGIVGCKMLDEKNKQVKNEDGISMFTGNYYKFIDILENIK